MIRCAILGCAASSLTITSIAHSQDFSGTPTYVEDLRSCQLIVEERERLACLDKSVSAILDATNSGELRIVRQEQIEQTRRSMFGFVQPKNGLFGAKEEIDTLQSQITLTRSIRGGWIITIEEGSVWQLNNVPARLSAPKTGDSVEFKKAALGSYFIRIDGQMGVKGRRIE